MFIHARKSDAVKKAIAQIYGTSDSRDLHPLIPEDKRPHPIALRKLTTDTLATLNCPALHYELAPFLSTLNLDDLPSPILAYALPKNLSGPGFKLWQIFNVEKIPATRAAKILGISYVRLLNIFDGTAPLPRSLVEDNDWGRKLNKACGSGWPIFGQPFLAGLSDTVARKRKPVRAPDDKESAGYYLWLIIGGPDANFAEASAHLKTTEQTLYKKIYGKTPFKASDFKQKGWKTILKTVYGPTWKLYGEAWEAALYKEIAARPPKKPVLGEIALWKAAAAEIMRKIIDDSGDAVEDVARDAVGPRVLKQPQTWYGLLRADTKMPAFLYRAALLEVTRLYNLPERPGDAYARVLEILGQRLKN